MSATKHSGCSAASGLTNKQFDVIEKVAQRIADQAGRKVSINADYANAAQQLYRVTQDKLNALYETPVVEAAPAEVAKVVEPVAPAAPVEVAKTAEPVVAQVEPTQDATQFRITDRPDSTSLTLTGDELSYFQGVFNNPSDLEDLHDTVPSATLNGSSLEFAPSESLALGDYASQTWGLAKKQYGGGGAKSIPRSFASGAAKFEARVRGAVEVGTKFYSSKNAPTPLKTGSVPSAAAVQSLVDRVQKTLAQFALPIEVVSNPSDIGIEYPGEGIPSGAVHNGRIYLFTDGISSMNEAAVTLFHELFHYGLSKSLNAAEYNAAMQQFASDPELGKLVSQWKASSEGKARQKNMSRAAYESLAVEEGLAQLGEALHNAGGMGSRGPALVRAAVKWVANVAQKMGMPDFAQKLRALTYTDAQIFVRDMTAASFGARGNPQLKPSLVREAGGATPLRTADPAVDRVAQALAGDTGLRMVADVGHYAKRAGLEISALHTIVDRFKGKFPDIKTWYDAMQKSAMERRKVYQLAENVLEGYEKLDGPARDRVNVVISTSTHQRKWAYGPDADPAMVTMYKALHSDAERAVVKAVFDHGESMKAKRRQAVKDLGLDGVLTVAGGFEGPYAPFKRFGDFAAVAKSDTYVAAEKLAEETGDYRALTALKGDPTHYQMSRFDTMGTAKEFARKHGTADGGKFSSTYAFRTSENATEASGTNVKTLNTVIAALKLDPGLDPKARKSVEAMVTELYLMSLDDQHARLSGLKRLNVAGYESDMMRSFMAGARADAGFMAQVAHGGEIASEFAKLRKAAGRERGNQDLINLVDAHFADSLSTHETPVQDMIMAATSGMQLLTSIGYHVTNFTQTVMVTLPQLAADFGNYSGAWGHIRDGYKQMLAVGISGRPDLSRVKNLQLREVLQYATDLGLVDTGMGDEVGHLERFRSGYGVVDGASDVTRRALEKLHNISRVVETANRVTTATAAYNMARQNGKTHAEAKAYAVSMLRNTQGDTSRLAKPMILKRLPKLMGQYRSYQMMMAALYAKAFRQAFSGDATERAIGLRMLAFKLGHTAFFAGTLGLPMMNVAGIVFKAIFGDSDEPDDLERTLRKAIGDPFIADLLLKGPMTAALGLDMSSKLGEENIFSIVPYTTVDLTSAQGVKNLVFGVMGPGASQVGRMADGMGLLQNGQYYKGVEKLVPKGLEDAMKSFRIANDGFTLKNDDVMFKPEDVSAYAAMLQAVGLPPTSLKKMAWEQSQQYEVNKFYNDRTGKITDAYVRAHRDGDSERKAELVQEWVAFQAGKDNLRQAFNDNPKALVKQPVSRLTGAPFRVENRVEKLQDSANIEN